LAKPRRRALRKSWPSWAFLPTKWPWWRRLFHPNVLAPATTRPLFNRAVKPVEPQGPTLQRDAPATAELRLARWINATRLDRMSHAARLSVERACCGARRHGKAPTAVIRRSGLLSLKASNSAKGDASRW